MADLAPGGSTVKQRMYARRLFSGEGKTKKEIALAVGYSPWVAEAPGALIESGKGFHNAMVQLAKESNELALEVIHEFKARGFQNFSNKELVGALNAIGGAWSKFNGGVLASYRDEEKKKEGNRLRQVVINQIENQTVLNGATHKPIVQEEKTAPKDAVFYETNGDPNDF